MTMSNRPVGFSLGTAVSDMSWMRPLREGYLLDAVLGSASSQYRVTGLHSDAGYRIRLGSDVAQTGLAFQPLSDQRYRDAVQRGLLVQRAAQYAHLLRNATRLAPGVFATLLRSTARNKWLALGHRMRAAR